MSSSPISSSWNDFNGTNATNCIQPVAFLVEWSADCNSDGIVDYGQCRNGTLADYDGNNVPDCCERGEPCVVAHCAVESRVEDGGNGHWYRFDSPHVNWDVQRRAATAAGGYLACIAAGVENSFVRNLIPIGDVAYLGAIRTASGWSWVSGEPWTYTNWNAGEPNGSTVGEVVWLERDSGGWNDHTQTYDIQGAIIEWSADCDNDGQVDIGQILRGEALDANANGVPDHCEITCADADLYANGEINGADLGILLSEWGVAVPGSRSDIDGDGLVNGVDLAYVLAFWGPCGG